MAADLEPCDERLGAIELGAALTSAPTTKWSSSS